MGAYKQSIGNILPEDYRYTPKRPTRGPKRELNPIRLVRKNRSHNPSLAVLSQSHTTAPRGNRGPQGDAMKIKYQPSGKNNFHDSPPIYLIISGDKTEGYGGVVYRISRYQARKISEHFCGISYCGCRQGGAEQLDENRAEYGIKAEYCQIRG